MSENAKGAFVCLLLMSPLILMVVWAIFTDHTTPADRLTELQIRYYEKMLEEAESAESK